MSETKIGSTVPLWTGGAGGGGGAPTGPAGGDLRGTYPNPLVQGLQTFPIALTAPVQGQALTWSGTAWHGFTQPYVVWRPGGVSADDVVATWAEVEARITATLGHIVVYVDTALVSPSPAVIPATANTECYGSVVFAPYTFNLQGSGQIQVADGGQLRNPFTLRTAGISGAPTTVPFIVLDIPGSLFICREGGNVTLESGATVSAIQQSADFCEVAQFEGASLYNNTGNPALPLVQVDPGFTCLHAIIALAGTAGPPAYAANTFGGDVTTILLQIFDASGTQVPQPNFLGFTVPLPMDFAVGVTYNDTTTTPAIGATAVQGVLDILKRRVTGAGGTGARPAIPADIDTGGMYFDTDLGIPVWSNGAIYVDATGTPA